MMRKLIYFMTLLAFVMSLVSAIAVTTPVKAQGMAPMGTISGMVRTGMLRLRQTPGIRGKTLLRLKRGTVVTVLGAAVKRRWLKVQTGTGQIGWVSSFFIRLSGVKLKDLPITQ